MEIAVAIINLGLLAAFFSHTGYGRRMVAWLMDDRPIKGGPPGQSQGRAGEFEGRPGSRVAPPHD